MTAPLLPLYRRLSRWPGGRWLFTRAVCFKAPYFAAPGRQGDANGVWRVATRPAATGQEGRFFMEAGLTCQCSFASEPAPTGNAIRA